MLRNAAWFAILFHLLAGGFLLAEEAEEKAPATPLLTLEAVEVTPSDPGADTLCQLRVKVRNAGEEAASRLAFRVVINGESLTVYDNQLYLQPLPPGEVSEVRLYNFWTTESTRRRPKDGKLKVEVELTEARWIRRQTSEDGLETRAPLGGVEGLPVSQVTTLTLKNG